MSRSFLDVGAPPKADEYATMLFEAIRQNIRKRILEEIEGDLSAAVEQAAKDLQVVVRTYSDYVNMSQTVNVVLEKAAEVERKWR